jgi:hypothetical protein
MSKQMKKLIVVAALFCGIALVYVLFGEDYACPAWIHQAIGIVMIADYVIITRSLVRSVGTKNHEVKNETL